ncbi:MAG: 50S ribosomal protein L10 [Nitrospirae bacterium]|jgi:large subunit ribosomal protein L10|nr:50S ribosomal protein L10 [Nitrospirota bacterium]
MWRLWGRGCKLNRTEKEQVIQELKNDFSRAKAVVFTDYRGMTVAELSDLRKLLREGNFEYKIVKNTLARIASEGTSLSIAKDSFKGPVGIAISYDDPVLALKKVLEFSKKNDKLKVNAGIVEGSLCEASDLKAVSELPSRQVLLSMMAGVFQAPLSKFASLLQASVSRFAYAVEALKTKKS